MTAQDTHSKKGFTLIELLVVIGILAILLAIVLVAINPARQFSLTNNTKRASNVNAILNGINQYMTDHKGAVPAGVPTTTAANIGNAVGQADLCAVLVPLYMAGLPQDPLNASTTDLTTCPAGVGTYDIGYQVLNTAGRVTVSAPLTELGVPVITVTR